MKQGFPEDMPRPVPPSWNSELVRQLDFVGKKLIKSGLLTVEEEKWWSDLSVAKIQGGDYEVYIDIKFDSLTNICRKEYCSSIVINR